MMSCRRSLLRAIEHCAGVDVVCDGVETLIERTVPKGQRPRHTLPETRCTC